jgi:hypothetical protein
MWGDESGGWRGVAKEVKAMLTEMFPHDPRKKQLIS